MIGALSYSRALRAPIAPVTAEADKGNCETWPLHRVHVVHKPISQES